MSIGPNIYQKDSSENSTLADADGKISSSLRSDITRTTHNVTLGNFQDGVAQVLSIAFSAESLEEAKCRKRRTQSYR